MTYLCLYMYISRDVRVMRTCCVQLKELPTLDEVTQFCSRLQTLKPAQVRTETASLYYFCICRLKLSLFQIFSACHLYPWLRWVELSASLAALGYVMYFQFCGCHHVAQAWWCRKACAQNDSPGGSTVLHYCAGEVIETMRVTLVVQWLSQCRLDTTD